jgi:hypothetical protein
VQVGNHLILGSPTGQLFSLVPSTGALTPFAVVDLEITDLALQGTDLFVSGKSGMVLRLDARTAAEKAAYQSGFEVQALAADEGVLYTGTPFGSRSSTSTRRPASSSPACAAARSSRWS